MVCGGMRIENHGKGNPQKNYLILNNCILYFYGLYTVIVMR
jgi:hypothetical protein